LHQVHATHRVWRSAGGERQTARVWNRGKAAVSSEETAAPAHATRVGAVPVLMYHSVSSSASTRFRPFTVPPERFAEHVEALRDTGREVRTVGEYTGTVAEPAGMAASADALAGAVVLTVDDAFSDFHSEVMPRLLASGMRATLFVPTAYVGGSSRWLSREGEGSRRLMSWSQLREAADAGVEIGSHSRTHRQLDLAPPDVLRQEVRDSRLELEDRLQQQVSTFAYPFGYHDARVRSAVVAAGYSSACAVRDRLDRRSDVLAVNRLTVKGDMTGAALVATLDRKESRWGDRRADVRAHGSRLLRRAGAKRRGPARHDEPIG